MGAAWHEAVNIPEGSQNTAAALLKSITDLAYLKRSPAGRSNRSWFLASALRTKPLQTPKFGHVRRSATMSNTTALHTSRICGQLQPSG
eukprot:4634134-Amphidinium_carterae.2